MLRACVVVILGFLSSFPLFSECSWRDLGDLRTREIGFSLSAAGGEVWFATGWGVAVRSESTGALLASIPVPGTTVAVEGVEGGAWAGSGSSLFFIRRNPRLEIAATLDLGSAINDIARSGSFLWVATATGVVQVDILNPLAPRVGAKLSTSTGSAHSVAVAGASLYVADGDRTIEIYTIVVPTLPQRIGEWESLPRTSSINAVANHLLASDGQQTEVIGGSGAALARVAMLPWGANSATSAGGSLIFIAGNDRKARLIDLSAPLTTSLTTVESPLMSGTVNRMGGVHLNGDLLLAAAGDAGVRGWTFDRVGAPFSVRFLPLSGGVHSSSFAGDRLIVAPFSGGLQSYSDASSRISLGATWATERSWFIHDGLEQRLLTSSGLLLSLWDVSAGSQTLISQITLRSSVRTAILSSATSAVVLLADQSLWRVDLSNAAATATEVAADPDPSSLARAGSAIVSATVRQDGTTLLRYWVNGELSSAPMEAVVEGAANSGVALSTNGVAAVATFRGLILVNFAQGGAVTVVPGTNASPVTDLVIAGDRVLMLTDRRLEMRQLTGGALLQSWELDSAGSGVVALGPKALVTSPEGFAVVNLEASAVAPMEVALGADENRFYRMMARDGERLWLVESGAADLFMIDPQGTARWSARIVLPANPVGIAATRGLLYSLSAAGVVSAWNGAGRKVVEAVIDESEDQQVGKILEAAGALWIGITHGCSAGGCQSKTVILDPANALVRTAALSGAVIDVVAHGSRAAAVFDFPDELRTYDLSNPAQPAVMSSRATEGDPVSVDFGNGIIWTLGDRLRAWQESNLTPLAAHLDAYVSEPQTSYLDQKVRIQGDCLLVAGRTAAPSLWSVHSATSISPRSTPAVSGVVKDVVVEDGSLHLLTETSLEFWTTLAPMERGRAVRR
ncbi:MAG TPA: hypothetical protein VM557_00405 [Thermoanaerobaculia bacterium]|nr:hypothetical protein [Thermoanaerobaculia bacterium]